MALTLYAGPAGGDWAAPSTWYTASNGGGGVATLAPTSADSCYLDAFSGPVTCNAGGTSLLISCAGHASTLTIAAGQQLFFQTSLTLSASTGTVAGTGSFVIASAAASIVPNGKSLPGLVFGVTSTLTMASDITVTGDLGVLNGCTATLGGGSYKLYVGGSLPTSGTKVTITGVPTIVMNGTGQLGYGVGYVYNVGLFIGCNLQINTTGVIDVRSFQYTTRTISWIAGSAVMVPAAVVMIAATVNTLPGSWNVIMNSNNTITITAPLSIRSITTSNGAAQTFISGDYNVTVETLDLSNSGGLSLIAMGRTLTVTNSLILTAGTYAPKLDSYFYSFILKYTGTPANCKINKATIALADASLSPRPLYAYNSTLTSCTNILVPNIINSVYQPRPFIFQVDTTKAGSASNQFILPLSGSTNCKVQWGDGTSNTYQAGGSYTHTYPSPGVYTVQIVGKMSKVFFYFATDALKIVKIVQWGNGGMSSGQSNTFYGCSNLVVSATDDGWMDRIVLMDGMFYGCSLLTRLNSTFGQATAINSAFTNCTALSSLPRATFDVASGDASYAFQATALTSVPAKFDKITNASNMFTACSLISSLPNATFESAQNANFSSNTTNLTSLSIPNLNLRSVNSNISWLSVNVTVSFYNYFLYKLATTNAATGLSVNGGTAHYDSTTGGYDGVVAAAALVARGWTITP